MSKLLNRLNPSILRSNRSLLVPSLFTERQLELLEKKLQEKKLSPVEQVYFSRTISRRLKAIDSLTGLAGKYFFCGENLMLPERKKKALSLLKKIERSHKNRKILISGSFLYHKHYRDIDIFFISQYEKEDYWKDRLHFNYLTSEATHTLFFHSLSQICLANFDPASFPLKEKPSFNDVISKYQEVISDIFNGNFPWLKTDLRDFLVDCSYAGEGIILNSFQLKNKLDKILRTRNKIGFVKKLFVSTLMQGFSPRIKTISLNMLKSYYWLIKRYPHKKYYQTLIDSFKEVLDCAS